MLDRYVTRFTDSDTSGRDEDRPPGRPVNDSRRNRVLTPVLVQE